MSLRRLWVALPVLVAACAAPEAPPADEATDIAAAPRR